MDRFIEKKEHKKREHKKKEFIESATDQIIAKTIGLIHDNYNHTDARIPDMYSDDDQDFYFSENMLAELKLELSSLEAKLEQKEYEKPKHEAELVAICTSWLLGFIEGQLQSKVKIDPSALEHANKETSEEARAPTPRRNRSSSESKNVLLLSPRNAIGSLFRSKSDRDTKCTAEDEIHQPKTPRNLSSGGKFDSEATAEKDGSTQLKP